MAPPICQKRNFKLQLFGTLLMIFVVEKLSRHPGVTAAIGLAVRKPLLHRQ